MSQRALIVSYLCTVDAPPGVVSVARGFRSPSGSLLGASDLERDIASLRRLHLAPAVLALVTS